MPLAFLGNLLSQISPAEWLDVACVLLVLASFFIGAWRGLSSELPPGAGWIFGWLAGWYAYTPIFNALSLNDILAGRPQWHIATAFLLSMLLAFCMGLLIRLVIHRLLLLMEGTTWDRVLGALFGLVRAFVVLLIATMILLGTPWKAGHITFCHESFTGRIFAPGAEIVLQHAKKLYAPHVEQAKETIIQAFRASFHQEDSKKTSAPSPTAQPPSSAPSPKPKPPEEPPPMQPKKRRVGVHHDPVD